MNQLSDIAFQRKIQGRVAEMDALLERMEKVTAQMEATRCKCNDKPKAKA